VVSYDRRKWGNPGKKASGSISIERAGGVGTAAIIAEREGIPTTMLADGLLEELGKEHPGLKLLFRETRRINGRELCCLKCSCQVNGIDLVLYVYCFGGLAGSFQIRTCARASAFDECEPDFSELMNSLEIRPLAHPALARLRHDMRFAVRVTRASLLVIVFGSLGIYFRANLRAALLIAAGLTIGVFAIAAIFGRRKYEME